MKVKQWMIAVSLSWCVMQTSAALEIDCDKAQSGPEMQYCEEQSFNAADAEMNRVYKALKQNMAGRADAWQALQKAQKLWVSFRDAHCEADTWGMMGTGLGDLINNCREALTEQRTAYLRRLLREQLYGETAPMNAEMDMSAMSVESGTASGYEPAAWFAILGSFQMSDAGSKAASELASVAQQALNDDSIIMSESVFYRGLTEGLYVVLKGPFETSANAKAWLKHPLIQQHLPDAYVKKAEARVMD